MELLADVHPKYTPKGIHIEELSIPRSQPNTVRLSTLLLRSDLSTPPQHVIVYLQGTVLSSRIVCHQTSFSYLRLRL